jgi:hypothetical protein
MKKIFLIVAFLFSAFVSFSQVIPKPNPTAVGIGYKRLLADSTIFIPTGGAIPRLGANNINRRSAIYADTINKKLYVFYPNDSTWKESGTDTASLSARIDARVKYADTSSMLAPYLRTANSHGVPSGGTSGQLLSKNSDSDYDLVWIDNYADWTSLIKQQYKATESITKGQAVYISGADGTNALISKASNASEITSSKTIGLLAQTLSTNGKGFVVTEGLLGGLNTATAIAGDPVWLGVNGDLIFGYLNKPHAPAHLVYLGVVTRANGSNGEILIKPQNGFEIKELHDVLAQSPSNNDGLFYNSGNSLWENKSIATALGYTPANAATYVPYTGATADVDLGNHNFSTNYSITSKSLVKSRQIIINGNDSTEGDLLGFRQFPSTFAGTYKTTAISASNNNALNIVFQHDTAVGGYLRYKSVAFKTDSLDINGPAKNYFFPNASGTLALKGDLNSYINTAGYGLSKSGQTILADTSVLVSKAGSQTISGSKTFTGFTVFDYGTTYTNNALLFAQQMYANKGIAFSDVYSPAIFADAQAFSINRYDTISVMNIRRDNVGIGANSYIQQFRWRNNVQHIYDYPDASGTIALTSNIPSISGLVPYTGATANLDLGTYNITTTGSSNAQFFYANGNGTIGAGQLAMKWGTGFSTPVGYSTIGGFSNGYYLITNISGSNKVAAFDLSGLTTSTQRTYTFPNASGTLALTSDIPSLSNYVTLDGTQTISGLKTFSNSTTNFNNPAANGTNVINFKSDAVTDAVISIDTNFTQFQSFGSYGYLFKMKDGANGLAIRNGGSGFQLNLPFSGTSGIFSSTLTSQSSVKGTNFILSGGTGNTGLYYGHTDRVVLANYTAGGIDFETNGGVVNMTLFPNGDLGVGASMTDDGSNKLQVAGNIKSTGDHIIGTIADNGVGYFRGSFSSVNTSTSLAKVRFGGGEGSQFRAYMEVRQVWNGSGTDQDLGFTSFKGGVGSSEAMTIKGSGNVGIGTTSPSYKLEVDASNPTNGIVGQFYNTATSSQNGSFALITQFGIADWFIGQPAATNALTFGNGKNLNTVGSEYMRITSGGNVLIGTTTDNGSRLSVQGAVNFLGTLAGAFWQDRAGSALTGFYTSGTMNVYSNAVGTVGTFNMSSGAYTAISDSSKKKDFEASTIGLNEVLQLKPTLFRMKTESSNSPKTLGFIAQEVKPFIPQAYVESGEGDNKFIGLNDRPIIAALVKSIQELQQQITDLKTQINK